MSDTDSSNNGTIDPRWVGLADAHRSGWYQKETGEVVRGFPVGPGDTVLDVGCGAGPDTLFCARQGAHVTFTDIDGELVSRLEAEIAKLAPESGYRGVVCDSDPLLVDDECATRVICREVLEHVADPGQVLGELVRTGRPGALFLLTVPGEAGEKIQQAFAPSEYFQHPYHVRIFSEQEFRSLVENAGLEIVSYDPYGFFLVFWMCMQWLIEYTQSASDENYEIPIEQPTQPPFHANVHAWSDLWMSIISSPKGLDFKREMDRLLPKNQLIIARKPE